ncbi:SDR family NAD(P)-dependent oxidoreductase [Bacillus sp. ISL-75]|uniref:SDR family NAD(P)-dependent oxidoreductase n=1 Tax=Bacillus sp. ISL-75 TaxID=2819137 RepID=UPI0020355CDD|nr:SDR family NAD(P)-dependent oxidoreductase [Bacillus sp. ISL-75]
MVEKAIHKWDKIDILVNNSGGGVILPFLEQTPETLKTTIDRNLWTMLWSCYRVLPHMVKQNYGRIINIGADSVRNGLWDHAAYNAAKGGVYAIVSGLGREFAKNLEQRALRLLKREAHVEYPHSTTLHNVTNVRIVNNEEDAVKVRCNFSTYRTKRVVLDNLSWSTNTSLKKKMEN